MNPVLAGKVLGRLHKVAGSSEHLFIEFLSVPKSHELAHSKYFILLYDVTSGSEMPCNKIDKPLVVYRFSGDIMK